MENWHQYFVPECFFDTVLFKKIMKTDKRLKHTKGCFNVVNRFKNINGRKGDLFDSLFGLGMVDKDRKELNFLKEECKIEIELPMLILWKRNDKVKKHYILQLNPPLEKWIIAVLDESNLKIEDFEYPREYKRLKKIIKNDIDNENDFKLTRLVNAILSTDHSAIRNLKTILLYFKEKTKDADVNKLKNKIEN
jgi:hypothetical protein